MRSTWPWSACDSPALLAALTAGLEEVAERTEAGGLLLLAGGRRLPWLSGFPGLPRLAGLPLPGLPGFARVPGLPGLARLPGRRLLGPLPSGPPPRPRE